MAVGFIPCGLFGLDAFVMVVYGNGEGLFGVLLADAVQIELAFDLSGLRDVEPGKLLSALGPQLLVEDILAHDDATVADVNAGPLDELLDFGVRFSAEA